jgi:hypothetical protein
MRNPLTTIRKLFRRTNRQDVAEMARGPVGFDEGGPARSLAELPDFQPDDPDGVLDEHSLSVTHEERDALLRDDSGDAIEDVSMDPSEELEAQGGIVPIADDQAIAGTLPVPDVAESRDPCAGEPKASPPVSRQERMLTGIGQLNDLLSGIREGLDTQHQRQDRLIEQFDGLPGVLRSVPAAAQRQLDLLESLRAEIGSLTGNTSSIATRLESLPEALAAIPETARAQTALLQKMSDQAGAQMEQSQQMVKGLGGMQQWLAEMSDTSQRQIRCLEDMESARQNDMAQITEVIQSQGRRSAALFVSAMVLAALSLAGVIVVGSLITNIW